MLRQDASKQIHVFRGARSRTRIATVEYDTVKFNGDSFFDQKGNAALDQNDHDHQQKCTPNNTNPIQWTFEHFVENNSNAEHYAMPNTIARANLAKAFDV